MLKEVQQDISFNDIYEKKQRLAMAKAFEDMKDASRVDNMLAGTSHEPANDVKPHAGALAPATAGKQPAITGR